MIVRCDIREWVDSMPLCAYISIGVNTVIIRL